MRLPILILVHIAAAHRVELDLTATTGEGSDTSSIAATALQNPTAVVGTHGSDRGVLPRAGSGIPGKLMQRLALILAASSVLGGPLLAVEAKAMPTAFVSPTVRRNALSGSGFRPSAMEAAGPDSVPAYRREKGKPAADAKSKGKNTPADAGPSSGFQNLIPGPGFTDYMKETYTRAFETPISREKRLKEEDKAR